MSTPAERYAAAKRRAAEADEVERFAAGYPFPLDDFQLRACRALQDGAGVLVAAPTGAGKTVVGEFAIRLALARGQKVFYTTPIKALSNQKYADLSRIHGASSVGLLTGDSSINGEAAVVVMTTEVLRNMLYAGSTTLGGLGFVVMDEVHYLADRFRGAVWEEVIIHLPRSVRLVSLSATVSNAEEFGAWLTQVRGATEVVVEEHRPVPLWQHMMVGQTVYDLFVEESPIGERARGRRGSPPAATRQLNPQLLAAIAEASRERSRPGEWGRHGRRLDAGAPRGRRGRSRSAPTAQVEVTATLARPPARVGRSELVTRLDREALLPAIVFIFSRAGCDAAVQQLLDHDVRLIPIDQGRMLRELTESRVAGVSRDDLEVLGYADFVEGLSRGFASHHAGMLPTFREVVEELFSQGAIRTVFATETLALGINMPARTVVLDKLVKFNGDSHVSITPGEYTQLTGRAGRRGIDVEGHAVVVWNPRVDPAAVAGLAATRTYPLNSSFRPTYNMAVNLVARSGRERAARVLETSFAQFQADRSVVGLTTQIRADEEAMQGYAEAMVCERGDFAEYGRLRMRLGQVDKDMARARADGRSRERLDSLLQVRAGDVVWLAGGRHPGLAVVVAGSGLGKRAATGPVSVSVLTHEARARRLEVADLTEPLQVVGRVSIPRGFDARSPRSRRDLAATMRAQVSAGPGRTAGRTRPVGEPGRLDRLEHERGELREQLRRHPCHGCPDREQHARWAERWWRLHRDVEGLRRRVEVRTHSVARVFERICDLLCELGYLQPDGQHVTGSGRRLRHLYAERDLLTAECLRHGVWDGLDPAGLAAVVSGLVYEPRRDEPDSAARMPNEAVAQAFTSMLTIWDRLEDRERVHDLPTTGPPQPGLAWMMHRWASGRRLGVVLHDNELAAGDFVRRCKQTVDLLDQIAGACESQTLATTARAAVKAVLRGVVAADRLD